MLDRCEKCGSRVVVAGVRTPGQELFLTAGITPGTSPIEARVCEACGYTTFYALHPAALCLPRQTVGVAQGDIDRRYEQNDGWGE